MRDANAEVWLASRRIELELREAVRRAQLPPRPSWSDTLRRLVGQALIAAGRRVLPAPGAVPARAA